MVGITKIMENTKNNKYEEAVKHVKKIKGFYKHVLIYFIINIILIGIKGIPVLYILNDNQNAEKVFIDWVDFNIWSTPILWGIGLLIHGLYVYRFKFSFFRVWEDRKIKEFMDQDDQEKDLTKNQKWWK